MKFFSLFTGLAIVLASVSAQQESICDKYTTLLLKENNSTNQLTVLTLVVNTALIGTYSNATGAPKNNVTGILNRGQVNNTGSYVDLLGFFNGTLKSSNRGGNPTAVNFLDGGGAAPLKLNMAANNNASNQYTLVTHLYQFFGTLLGCSQQGSGKPFDSYQGVQSMSKVHRFMNLDRDQMNYFIQEVGLSATSFGVSSEDATAVGNSLNAAFNYRCEPAAVIDGLANVSQSICLASSCPLANNSNCAQEGDSYGNGTSGAAPQLATSSGGSSSSGSGGGKDSSAALLVNAVAVLALTGAGVIALSL